MLKTSQQILSIDVNDQKRVPKSARIVATYVLSILTLLTAIFFSYSVLQNVITTQRTLTKVNTLVRDTQFAVTDSTAVLNDYRQEIKTSEPGSRLVQLITRRASNSVSELKTIKTAIENMTTKLEATPVWDEIKWIIEDKNDSLHEKLGDYIRQMELTTTQVEDTSTTTLTQIPVEAAGTRYGAMLVGYQKASDLLEEKINENSARIENVHRAITALIVTVVLLISIFVVVPLWRRVIREHQQLEEAHNNLYKIAYTDKATGLPNLDGLESQLNHQNSSPDSSTGFYLLLVRFKNLDELYNLIGSHKVDELLQSVSRRLETWDNRQLQWCRSGEAEFSAIISEQQFGAADEWIQALHNSVTGKLTVEGIIVRPEVSMAVSRIKNSETFCTDVLWEHQSNARLASVNFNPPICWLPEYQPGMKNKLAARNDLINRISEGIKAGEFLPYYQLKFCAKTGQACSVEVLARWITPDGTLVSPGEFIPAAESSGLIIKLTYSLFNQVLTDINQWCASGLPIGRVAINVAADVLHHTEFLNRLDEMNKSLPALCEGLEMEITENIALGDQVKQTSKILQHIRAMGIHVAIDDFGTGYASLQTLIDTPLDVLKIDRSFVLPMTESGEGNEVVSAMISLSNKLKKKCVVEGIETEWQWTQLAELGADELQGFFFHKPSNYSDTTEFLHHSIDWKMTG